MQCVSYVKLSLQGLCKIQILWKHWFYTQPQWMQVLVHAVNVYRQDICVI